jgi:hypothetical protein
VAVLSCAFGYGWREFVLHHLVVAPGSSSSRLVSTNVADFRDQTGSNRFVLTTNYANAGASIVGPRIAVTIGGVTYMAVTNRSILVTNNGSVSSNIFINGILSERVAQ